MAVGGAVGSAVDQAISEGTIDYGQVAIDGATSGAMGGIFHGVRGNINRHYSTGRPLYDTSGDISSPGEAHIKTQKPEVYKEPVRKNLTGRAKNKLRSSSEAQGDHTVFKRDKSGKVIHYATFVKNPKNPTGFDLMKEFHETGRAHYSKFLGKQVDIPHIIGRVRRL